jgi:hypothetical protein
MAAGGKSFMDCWMRMTFKQRLYIVVMQLIGAMALDLVMNLFFGYLKYKNILDHIVPVWGWPELVSGHVVVETIVQSVLTWVIAGGLVRG